MNKYEAAQVIKACRPDLTEYDIKIGISRLMAKSVHSSEYFFTLAIVAAEQGEPMPWEKP